MRWNGQVRPRAVLGVLALGLVPVLVAAGPLAALSVLLGVLGVVEVGVGPVLLAAVVVGLGGSYALGPVVVDRALGTLSDADLDDRKRAFVEHRVQEVAEEVGVEPPPVTAVRADAANVLVANGYRGPRLVVSTRLLGLDREPRDAALRHALVRLRDGDAAVITALLPPALGIELLALVGTELARRRDREPETDRSPNRLHGYEPDEERIPTPVYRVAGAVLLLALVPLWIPAALGDRLYVAGSRRAADTAVARDGHGDALADAVEYARDATGASDWPPSLDRLSLVPMGDEGTRRLRGTSRQETRVRLARLRSKRI